MCLIVPMAVPAVFVTIGLRDNSDTTQVQTAYIFDSVFAHHIISTMCFVNQTVIQSRKSIHSTVLVDECSVYQCLFKKLIFLMIRFFRKKCLFISMFL